MAAKRIFKILHRAFGILLAVSISFGVLYLLVELFDITLIHNYYIRAAAASGMFLIIFALPPFLGAIFTPGPKKYGAIAGLLTAGLFLFALLLYSLFIENYRFVTVQAIFTTSACFSGAAGGFVAGYLVFKDKGWEPFNEEAAEDIAESF